MFKKKTYETITASLRNLVKELHDHADDHLARALDHQDAMERHAVSKRAATDEALRARGTALKVQSLLED